jgi:acetyltransferase-like isoleucine patch superfamily enzyme
MKKFKKIYLKYFATSVEYARYLGVNVGENCFIAKKVYYSSEPYLISIGNNVRIASDVKFFTHGGLWPFRRILGAKTDVFGKVSIGNNVHIGDSVFLMPGVTIGDDCVIGARAVVSKSVPSGSIFVGNPGKVVGSVDKFLENMKKMDIGSKGLSFDDKREMLINLPDDRFIKK